MLQTLVSLVQGAQTVVYYTLYYSVHVGQFLVSTIKLILGHLLTGIECFWNFCSILWESVSIFLQDVTLGVQQIMFAVLQTFEVVFGAITFVFMKVVSVVDTTVFTLSSFCNFLVNCIYGIFTALMQLCFFIKRLVLLFGSGVWFLVTLIPLFVVYTSSLIIYYFGRLFQEGYEILYSSIHGTKNLFSKSFYFVTDIPIECLAGLMIGVSLIYIFTQFYITIGSYFYRQLCRIARQIKNTINSREIHPQIASRQLNSPYNAIVIRSRPSINQVVIRTPVVPSTRITSSSQRSKIVKTTKTRLTETVDGDDSRNCVICLVRLKCVLLLPCCHLCMCVECSSELRYYNNICPICRKDIESTMRIFV